MGYDFGTSMGDLSGWPGGVSAPTAKVTDLSAHVDGGPASARGTNQVTVAGAQMNMYMSAGIVGLALVLLALSGGIVFKSHNF